MAELNKTHRYTETQSKWKNMLLSIPALLCFAGVFFIGWDYPLQLYWSMLFLALGVMPLIIFPSLDQIGYKTEKMTVISLLSFSAVILAMLLIKAFIEVFPYLSYGFLASFMLGVLMLHILALYRERDPLLTSYLAINAVFVVLSYDFLNQQIIKLPF